MELKEITLIELQQEEQATESLLRDLDGTDQESERLKLTGLEILAFLGAKLVIPIVSSFLSRAVYEKYKDMQTKSQAEKARQELIEQQKLGTRDIVDEQTVINDLSASLVKEGYSQEQAREVVTKSFKRLKEKFSQ